MLRNNNNSAVIFNAFLVGAIGILLWILQSLSALSNEIIFCCLTLLLLAYLFIALIPIRHNYPKNWLVHPLTLCTFITFVMGYGATNFIYYESSEILAPLGIEPGVSTPMLKHMELVLLGAIALVLGNQSRVAINMARPASVMRFQTKYLPNGALRTLSIPVIMSISIISGLVTIKMGLMGYSSSYEELIDAGKYTMYLTLLNNLGKLALVLAALSFYSQQGQKKIGIWLIILIFEQLLFGFLSGMKSSIGMPFVTLIICKYLKTGKISTLTLLMLLASIIVAYTVIEPFRYTRNNDITFDGTSIKSIINTLITPDISEQQTTNTENIPGILLSFSVRSNIVNIGSYGLVYADENPDLPLYSPAFLEDIFMAPLHALIPRFIWTNKPLGNLGLWYNQVVMGTSNFSSTALGSFTYLYFAGGFLAVFIGFYFIGIVQHTLFTLLQPNISMPGSVVYLVCLGPLTVIDSSFNTIIIFLCRELPIVLVLMFIIFKRKPVK